jgi:hypothetical protein
VVGHFYPKIRVNDCSVESYSGFINPGIKAYDVSKRHFIFNIIKIPSPHMHTFNIIARTVVSIIWIGLYFLSEGQISEVVRSLLAGVILGDVVTWIIYQLYLLPKNIFNLSIGSIVNTIAVIVLLKFVKIHFPQSPEWMAISLMVCMAVMALKVGYYYLLEMNLIGSEE